MAGVNRKAAKSNGFRSEVRALREEFNTLVDTDVEKVRKYVAHRFGDQVVQGVTAGGLSVDTNAQDVETDNAIIVRRNGNDYLFAAQAAIDISTLSAGAATLGTSKSGIAYVFALPAGTADVEVDKDAQDYATVIEAWTAWFNSANTLPPSSGAVPIGAIEITEGGSGLYTWGTDSITAETEFYYDFVGKPAVETAAASFAIDASAAKVAYGAGIGRLGSGIRVSYTGKTAVVLTGSNVADGGTGAWLLMILADDSERMVQLDNDYGDLATARAAVRDYRKHPYLIHAATLYVVNRSGANFVPATTLLSAPGIETHFDIELNFFDAAKAFAGLVAQTVNA